MPLHRIVVGLALAFFVQAARAETIDVYDDHGGIVPDYDAHWAELGARNVSVRIVGPCQSACTILLAHIPRERICVMPDASFGFHLAGHERSTEMLWNAYAPDLRDWIDAHGGLTHDFLWLRTPDIFNFFRKC